MNIKEFRTLVETLDLDDEVKNMVLKALGPGKKQVPLEWDYETHNQQEVVDEDGQKYILLDISTLTNRYYAIPLDEDGELRSGGGVYLDCEKPLYFTGRKFILARTDVPEDIKDIAPGERFVGKYNNLDAILVRADDDDLPWLAYWDIGHDSAFGFEIKLHRRLVEV